MSRSALPQTGDLSELRSRAQSVAIGARVTAAAAVAGIGYAMTTWHQENRLAIVLLFAFAIVWGLTTLAVGPERLVHSRHSLPLLLGWSLGAIAVIAGLAFADGGTRSPLALLFFLPLAFVALSYPLPLVVAVGAVDVLAFVGVGIARGDASQAYLAFYATCLGIMALLCAWEAREHDRQREALARVSRADPLTGCLNRRGFEERLEAELDAGMRTGRRLGLVLLDLDDFKTVNDTRGHAAGDDLLRWTVASAGALLRPMDSLGRLGGDEFAILIPGAAPSDAREVAQRVREALDERVSLSTGVAAFPADGTDRDALFRKADEQLYAAKHGRAPAPSSRELDWAAALARAVDSRSPDEHSAAVAHYAAAIARRLGWSGADLALLRMAAMLHDVGKAAVPERVLAKSGPLTVEEYEQIKGHPVVGAEIVEQIGGLSPIVDWIRHSHEHIDGSGYPDGIAGERIPLASRILLVADAFDAMTSSRPYGSALAPEIALEEMHAWVGQQFDAECVEKLEHYLAEVPVTDEALAA